MLVCSEGFSCQLCTICLLSRQYVVVEFKVRQCWDLVKVDGPCSEKAELPLSRIPCTCCAIAEDEVIKCIFGISVPGILCL